MNHNPEPISLTVHSVAAPQVAAADVAQRTTRGRLKMLAVFVLCALPVIASYFTYYVIRPQGRGNYATLILPTRAMPELTLRDLEGRPVQASALKRQWLLVTATPSRCEGGCEQLLYLQRQLREMLGRDRDRVDRLWLVLDDGPITPAQLQGARAAGGLTVARADRAAVSAWLEPEAGRGIDDHLYVVDPMGEWMMRLPAAPDPTKAKRDLERLLRASASWDRAGR